MQKSHIIEITSGVNAAIYSAISDAIGKAPAPIKAGLFLYEQAGEWRFDDYSYLCKGLNIIVFY
jgi:hypothetical protein